MSYEKHDRTHRDRQQFDHSIPSKEKYFSQVARMQQKKLDRAIEEERQAIEDTLWDE